ncbi:MAG: hypothetical protein EXQ55_06190 [Acidobacteria bacterium]|nr:hypothetical protein [Acidobacteriota bacterium]
MLEAVRGFIAAALIAVACLPARADVPTLAGVQREFYSARYDAAAAQALALIESNQEELAAYEIRTSALHFQLKATLGSHPDKDRTFKECVACPALMNAFLSDTERGQLLARARLEANPADDTALFFLGKLDLNYVWLALGTLGRKTGWKEYWEARRSLDTVLKRNPRHVRARVARAWIDYIVDTRMALGTKWLLGGGSKNRAFSAAREAASTEADLFTRAEAEFALWEMLVRDRNLTEATPIAQKLARDFPENLELTTFLKKHDPTFQP